VVVFVDMSGTGTPQPLHLALLLNRASSYNHIVTTTDLVFSSNTSQLNSLKLGVRASLAGDSKLASGPGIRTEIRQSLELKRSARNRMVM
jgi:hypothetical protein